jgi:uncharacterized protein (DUF697 family)
MANQSTNSPDPKPDTKLDPRKAEERLDRANEAVQCNVYWAMGAGVLPLPVFDIIAITGVQLKMLRELSKIYEVTFTEGVAKKAVTALLVGIGGVGIGGLIGASLFKFVPFVGLSLGMASVPVVSGMLTHAVGRTFVMHFEAGGTLLDFNPKAMRRYFEAEFRQAKQVVTEMRKNGPAEGSAST